MEARLLNKLQSGGQWLRRLLRNKMLILMVGGALGTYLRYMIGRWFNSQPWGQTFPYGTLFINVSGSFILGAAAVIILERLPPEHRTGICWSAPASAGATPPFPPLSGRPTNWCATAVGGW